MYFKTEKIKLINLFLSSESQNKDFVYGSSSELYTIEKKIKNRIFSYKYLIEGEKSNYCFITVSISVPNNKLLDIPILDEVE